MRSWKESCNHMIDGGHLKKSEKKFVSSCRDLINKSELAYPTVAQIQILRRLERHVQRLEMESAWLEYA